MARWSKPALFKASLQMAMACACACGILTGSGGGADFPY